MAGSIVVHLNQVDNTDIKVVQVDWVNSPNLALNTAYSIIDKELSGWYVFMAETIPGAGGAAPDANYDIALNNSAGTDMFGGEIQNRSQTANEVAIPKIDASYGPFPVKKDDVLTLVITGQTNALGTGTIYFYFSRYK